jgi:hypothetical protein
MRVGFELSVPSMGEALAALQRRSLRHKGLLVSEDACEDGCDCASCSSDAVLRVQGRRDPAAPEPGRYVEHQYISRVLTGAAESWDVLNALCDTLDSFGGPAAEQARIRQTFQVSVDACATKPSRLVRAYRRYLPALLRLTWRHGASRFERPTILRWGLEDWKRRTHRDLVAHADDRQRQSDLIIGIGDEWADLAPRRWWPHEMSYYARLPEMYALMERYTKGQRVLTFMPNRTEFRFDATYNRERLLWTLAVVMGLSRASVAGFSRAQLEQPLHDFVRPYLVAA